MRKCVRTLFKKERRSWFDQLRRKRQWTPKSHLSPPAAMKQPIMTRIPTAQKNNVFFRLPSFPSPAFISSPFSLLNFSLLGLP
ncbi:hypothetical protein HZB94_01380 [Candidatus Falkowbacteria bacterium]|nr:hypothetical protein [Candidatus Falkowbacteria bacterium]